MGMKCENCGRGNEAATCCTDVFANPNPGDVSICLYCGHITVFADDLTLREPTAEEMHDIAGNPDLLRAQEARGFVMRKT